MKKTILAMGGILAVAILSACGGGGGGGNISVNTETPLIIDEDANAGGSDSTAPPVQAASPFDTKEYRKNWALPLVNALYAYNRGYHGQGVTVGFLESSLSGPEYEAPNNFHEDLQNIILSVDASITTRATHASGVAGVIGGARNGNTSHGVAPSVQLVWTPDRAAALQHPDFRRAKILNYSVGVNSEFNTLQEFLDWEFRVGDPDSRPPFYGPRYISLLIPNNAVAVFSAGNSFDQTAPFDFELNRTLPVIYPELEPHWIVVAGLDFQGTEYNFADLTLVNYSDACGHGKNWCVAAPAEFFSTPRADSKTAFTGVFGGTSAAAPVVSGVMAVLQSAAPKLPATMIRAIMLTTTRDLGEPGIDDLYGWGVPDLEAGIKHIENLQTAKTRGLPPVKLRALEQQLPAQFSHLYGKLAAASVAVQIANGAYYNMPLSDIIQPAAAAPRPLKNAAAKILNERPNVADETNSGFAAFGDSKNGFGLQWRGVRGKTNIRAQISHFAEKDTFMGAHFGALGAAAAKTNAAKIFAARPLFGGFSAFGEYGYADIRANTGGGYIRAINNANTEEWAAGISYTDAAQKGGKLLFSVRRAAAIGGGEMILQTPAAKGDFYKSFLGETAQELEIKEWRIPLKSRAPLIWTAGYKAEAFSGEWSAAAEYNGKSGEKKLTATWRINL